MRLIMICAVAITLFLQPLGHSQTEDEARAIINKAIKAMGVDKDSDDFKGLRMKSKGTLELMGMTLNISQAVTIRYPDQFKEAVELDANNMKIPIITVFDGKKGWVEVNGQVVMKFDDKINAEMKEVASLIRISRLKPLLNKKYELAVTGEVKVEEKPAIGIRVTTKGAKDVSLYFDKQTGLLSKVERQALDVMSGQEIQEERIIRSYQDKDGRKLPHQVAVLRDGKKFLEVEVTEFSNLDSVDPGEFEMPK
jgi:hypothetical protein